MTKNESLANWRLLVVKHNWSEADEVLLTLLEKLEPREIVKFAVAQLRIFLPVFEKYHPETTAPHEMLDLLSQGEPISPSIPFPALNTTYSSPGAYAFIDALRLIDEASQHQDDPHFCAFKVAQAILNVLSARSFEYSLTQFPSAWELAPNEETEAPPRPIRYIGTSETERFKEDIRLHLVNALEDLMLSA